MRTLSLLIAFCFSMNVMASTGTIQELERHLDDYHYSLSVEWDQENNEFYETKTQNLFQKLETLIKEEGLTQEQIMLLAEKKMKDSEALESIKFKLSLLPAANSSEELAKILREASQDFYAQGASWNGEVIFGVTIALALVAAVGYAIWWNVNHECVAYEEQYVCNTYSNCHGGYRYGGCYGSYTTCGYTDVCTEYQRK